MWKWLKSLFAHQAPVEQVIAKGIAQATLGLTTQPIVLVHEETFSQSVKQAFYRLDAILRHLEQHAEVPKARLQEYRAEAYKRAAYLLEQKVITGEECAALLRPIMNLIEILS